MEELWLIGRPKVHLAAASSALWGFPYSAVIANLVFLSGAEEGRARERVSQMESSNASVRGREGPYLVRRTFSKSGQKPGGVRGSGDYVS